MFLNDMSTIVRYTGIFMNRNASDENITSAENYILLYLFGKPSASQEDISKYFSIDKGSISKSVNRLAKNGFITKTINPENKRENIIALTEYGRKTFSENKKALDLWHNKMMEGISIDQFKQLIKTLSIMAENAVKTIQLLEEEETK